MVQPNKELVIAYLGTLGSADLDWSAQVNILVFFFFLSVMLTFEKALIDVFYAAGSALDLLKHCIVEEIQNTSKHIELNYVVL